MIALVVFPLIAILCCESRALKLDATTTTTQIIQSLDEMQTLTGRLAIVTGSTSGLGKETVRSLAILDCTVIMAVRNTQKAAHVKDDIMRSILKDKHTRTTRDKLQDNIQIMQLDLSSLSSVLKFANEFYRNYAQAIDYLFNNAAIMAVPEYTETSDGFEQQIGVNYLGHYYLTRLLMNKLLQTRSSKQPSRIISVSSRASNYATEPIGIAIEQLFDDNILQAKEGYDGWRNYGTSKAFQILFARELQRRMGAKGIISVSLHPGVIKSGLQKYLAEELINSDEFQFDKDLEQGTATQLWVALMPLEQVVTGGYYVDCQFHNDLLRDDLKPVSGYWDNERSDGINTMENRLWQVSAMLIRKKGFALSDNMSNTKEDL